MVKTKIYVCFIKYFVSVIIITVFVVYLIGQQKNLHNIY